MSDTESDEDMQQHDSTTAVTHAATAAVVAVPSGVSSSSFASPSRRGGPLARVDEEEESEQPQPMHTDSNAPEAAAAAVAAAVATASAAVMPADIEAREHAAAAVLSTPRKSRVRPRPTEKQSPASAGNDPSASAAQAAWSTDAAASASFMASSAAASAWTQPSTPTRTPKRRRLASSAAAPNSASSSCGHHSETDSPAASAASAFAPSHASFDDGRASKGMRQFAQSVCEVVQRQAVTSYTKVADELVEDVKLTAPPVAHGGETYGTSQQPPAVPGSGNSTHLRMADGQEDDDSATAAAAPSAPASGSSTLSGFYGAAVGGSGTGGVVGGAPRPVVSDERNIRRRVYDVLNVLEAVQVISKDHKVLRWIGLPDQLRAETEHARAEALAAAKRIHDKRQRLVDMLVEQVCLKNLIEHNRRNAALQAALLASESAAATRSTAAAAAPVPGMKDGAAAPATPLKASPLLSAGGAALVSPLPPLHPSLHLQQRNSAAAALLLRSPALQRYHSPFLSRLRQAALASHAAAQQSSSSPKATAAVSSVQPTPTNDTSALASGSGAVAAEGTGVGGGGGSASLHSLPLPFLLLSTARSSLVFVEQSDDRTQAKLYVQEQAEDGGGSSALAEHGHLLRALHFDRVRAWDLPRFLPSRNLCAFYPPEAIVHEPTPPHFRSLQQQQQQQQ